MLTGMDGVIGRVLKELKKQGLADNTIVVYMADNGYYMGDRGFAGKWSHYEQSLRVPMIIHDPRLPKAQRGRVVDPMALNIDLPSTFLDWAGVKPPASYQGRSLAPIVNGKTPPWRDDFFCEHLHLHPTITWEGVRNKRYIYARYFDQDPAYEFLHDLEKDPDQLTNFAGDAKYADILSKMRRRCAELVKQHGGPMPPMDQRKRKRKRK
jgi:arylsulfatase A-like enzyme